MVTAFIFVVYAAGLFLCVATATLLILTVWCLQKEYAMAAVVSLIAMCCVAGALFAFTERMLHFPG